MYTGTYRRPNATTRNVVTVDNINLIEPDNLVALNVLNCDQRPLVARVIDVSHDNLDIVWLEGSYTRPWKISKRKEGRAMVDWTDTVPKSSVILFDFQLTKTGRLQKATIEHLKETYCRIDS